MVITTWTPMLTTSGATSDFHSLPNSRQLCNASRGGRSHAGKGGRGRGGRVVSCMGLSQLSRQTTENMSLWLSHGWRVAKRSL